MSAARLALDSRRMPAIRAGSAASSTPTASRARARARLAAPPVASHALADWRPRTLEPLERLFGCDDLAFGAPDSGFAFARARLDDPLHGDPRLLATIQASRPRSRRRVRACSRRAWPHTTRARPVLRRRGRGALGVSARTLQRRLFEGLEGTTLLAWSSTPRARRSRASDSADPASSLVEIAERVGFSDSSPTSRARSSAGRQAAGPVPPRVTSSATLRAS